MLFTNSNIIIMLYKFFLLLATVLLVSCAQGQDNSSHSYLYVQVGNSYHEFEVSTEPDVFMYELLVYSTSEGLVRKKITGSIKAGDRTREYIAMDTPGEYTVSVFAGSEEDCGNMQLVGQVKLIQE